MSPRQNGRHFTDIFKCIPLNETFDWNFTDVCSIRPNWQYASIASDHGLAPNRRQAVILNNDGMFIDVYMRHSGSMR